MPGFELAAQQLGVPADDAQEVVEVVGHAARQPAQGLHLLGLCQQLLGFLEGLGRPLARGHVLLDGQVARDPAALVAHRRDRGLLPEELAVLAAVQELAPPDAPGGERDPQVLVHLGRRLARLEQARVGPHGLGRGVARDLGEARVDVLDHALRVRDDHHHRALLDGLPELPHPRLDPAPLGHVEGEDRDAGDLASVFADRVVADLEQPLPQAGVAPGRLVEHRLARQGTPAELLGPRPVAWLGDGLQEALPERHLRPVGLPGGAGVDLVEARVAQPAIEGEDGLGWAVEDGLEERRAFPQGRLGAVAGRDVARHAEHGGRPAGGVAEQRRDHLGPDCRPFAARQLDLARLHALRLVSRLQRRQHRVQVLRDALGVGGSEHRAERPAHDLLGSQTAQPANRGADVREAQTVQVERPDHVGGVLRQEPVAGLAGLERLGSLAAVVLAIERDEGLAQVSGQALEQRDIVSVEGVGLAQADRQQGLDAIAHHDRKGRHRPEAVLDLDHAPGSRVGVDHDVLAHRRPALAGGPRDRATQGGRFERQREVAQVVLRWAGSGHRMDRPGGLVRASHPGEGHHTAGGQGPADSVEQGRAVAGAQHRRAGLEQRLEQAVQAADPGLCPAALADVAHARDHGLGLLPANAPRADFYRQRPSVVGTVLGLQQRLTPVQGFGELAMALGPFAVGLQLGERQPQQLLA